MSAAHLGARDLGAQRRRCTRDAEAHRAHAARAGTPSSGSARPTASATPRSLAFVTSLLLVQGVIVLVGVAAALGDTDLSASIVRADQRGGAGSGREGADRRRLPRVPRPARPVSTSSSSSSGSTALITGDHADGPDRAGAEPPLRDRAGPPHGARSTAARSCWR